MTGYDRARLFGEKGQTRFSPLRAALLKASCGSPGRDATGGMPSPGRDATGGTPSPGRDATPLIL
jgi:hypothetical protein